jgi:DNA-binding GntR family transcriptional regulator
LALSDDAYERLRSAIRDGAFAPGERIKLREVADAFDMSVTPVRDGLARLVAERVLDALPNRAVCVPRPTAETVTEVRRIRCELEGLAASEAAGRITSGQLAVLKEHQASFELACAENDAGGMRSSNAALHFAIYAAAGMPLLNETISSFWLRDGPVQNLMYSNAPDVVRNSNRHLQLIDRLWARDSLGAREAVVADISAVTPTMITLLDTSSGT